MNFAPDLKLKSVISTETDWDVVWLKPDNVRLDVAVGGIQVSKFGV